MLHKMPVILLIIIATTLLATPYLPLGVQAALYAISLTIKSVIIFALPFVIFGLLFKTVVGLAQRATTIIALILLCVCCSNALSTFLSHYVGAWIYHFDMAIILPKEIQELMPTWKFALPKLIANDKAMFSAIILGLILSKIKPTLAQQIATKLDAAVGKGLKAIVYFIPLFVAGFVVKLQHDGVMQTIIKDYTIIFGVIALAQFSYVGLAYALLNQFKLKKFFVSIKNMLPAAVAGFSTMSSAAAMPLTIVGAENNADNKDLARSVIPATVNIHLIGDCFAIPIFAYAVMKSFGVDEPTLLTYLVFVFYFVLAKFSVAAVPGGGILVMLPILEAYLGFNAEMLSLITALYILFDPIITCANILGNGAFARLIDKLVSLRMRKQSKILLGDSNPA